MADGFAVQWLVEDTTYPLCREVGSRVKPLMEAFQEVDPMMEER